MRYEICVYLIYYIFMLLLWKAGPYLVQDVDVVVFRGEGGVAVAQPVHHGAAGDNDGGKQSADAVLEGWQLNITNKDRKVRDRVIFTATALYTCVDYPPHPLALLLRRPILVLDALLEFGVSPVEEDLGTLTGDQQALHLDHRRTPVPPHCGVLFYSNHSMCITLQRERLSVLRRET